MTNKELTKNYWRYYCMLEQQLVDISDIVEIHPDNYCTFSKRFALLLQAVGAELDLFFKVYCGYDLSGRKTINDYASILLSQETEIISLPVNILGQDCPIIPFKDWNKSNPAKSLAWWQAYDDIKHNRSGNLRKANLKNVLMAMSGLYLLEMKAFKKFAKRDSAGKAVEHDIPCELSQLFQLNDWYGGYVPIGDSFFCS